MSECGCGIRPSWVENLSEPELARESGKTGYLAWMRENRSHSLASGGMDTERELKGAKVLISADLMVIERSWRCLVNRD